MINDQMIVNSKPLNLTIKDISFFGVQNIPKVVEQGTIWVASSYNDRSYDSRYFGGIRLADIDGIAVPVFIKGEVMNMYRTVQQ